MSTDQPPPGPSDDPFANRPPQGDGSGAPGGSPYDRPSGRQQPPNEPPNQPPPGSPYGGSYGPPPAGGPRNPYEQNPWEQGGQGGGNWGQGGQGGQGGGGGNWGGPGGPAGPGGPYQQGPYGGAPDPLAGMAPLAPAGRRILARIIDIVIVLIPAFLLDLASVGWHGDSNFSSGRSAVGGVFTFGIGFLYEFFMTRATGQTVGKRVMGLRAAMLDNGNVPTPNASALRALVLWLPAFCCSCVWFVVIGLTVLADRPYKQGIHDKAAKTVVVQAG
jgi:uncharacterized RDD family membrane protein YckC